MSYLITTACQFGRYIYTRQLLSTALAGDMSQEKNDEIFKELPNTFGIAGYILVVG